MPLISSSRKNLSSLEINQSIKLYIILIKTLPAGQNTDIKSHLYCLTSIILLQNVSLSITDLEPYAFLADQAGGLYVASHCSVV